MQSPVGVAEFYKRYSFVRLPGVGFLFCEEKEPKVTRGGPRDPLTLKLRLDTNDALAASVRRRRYALKVPAAHFYVEIVDRVPLPRCGGGVGGAEPSAASGGCSEAEHP